MEPKRKILSKDAGAKGKKQEEAPAEAKPERTATPGKAAEADFPGEEPTREPQETAAQAPPSGKKWSGLKKAVVFGGSSLCALAIVSGLLLFKFGFYGEHSENPTPKIQPVTSIKRPIPIPDYKEMLDFLILYDVAGQKALTAFRMEFGFQNPNRYRNFKEANVVFRDTIYAFLQSQNLPRNNVKVWQTVVQKDLLDYLKVKLPQSQADSIRLTQVENL